MNQPGGSNQNLSTAATVLSATAAVAALVPLWREDVGLILLTATLAAAFIFVVLHGPRLLDLLGDRKYPARQSLSWLAVLLVLVAVGGAFYWGGQLVAGNDEVAEAPVEEEGPGHVAESPATAESPPDGPGLALGNVSGPAKGDNVGRPDAEPEKLQVRDRRDDSDPPPAESDAALSCDSLDEARTAFEERAWRVARSCMVQMSVSASRPMTCRKENGTVVLSADYTVVGLWRNDSSVFRLCYRRSGPLDPGAIGHRLMSGNFREVCGEKGIDPAVLRKDC